MSYEDKTLTCRECGTSFVWTAGEQDFYNQRGLVNQPGRCPACRANRRQQQGGAAPAAGGGYDRPARTMYAAICSQCGQETQVPFEPRGDKPVYCSTCFQERRQSSDGGGGGGGSYGRDRY